MDETTDQPNENEDCNSIGGSFVESDDYEPYKTGLTLDLLSFSVNGLGFSLLHYAFIYGKFSLIDFSRENRDGYYSRALLGFDARPFGMNSAGGGRWFIFDTEHVTVDILWMQFRIKKHFLKRIRK